MSVLYIFLSLLMFLDCVILVFFVLLQLPKKEAGAGMAFGGGATDALFGAGSGNVLSKITQYAGGIFFSLAIIMAVVAAHQHPTTGGGALQEELMKHTSAPVTAPATAPSANPGILQTPLLSNVPPVQSAPAKAPGRNPPEPGPVSV